MVLAVALAFGGIAQMLAGMWEFRKGNGGFWRSAIDPHDQRCSFRSFPD